jgi:hypothetical protein
MWSNGLRSRFGTSHKIVIERYLKGPLVYAETAVRRGRVFRCTCLACKRSPRRPFSHRYAETAVRRGRVFRCTLRAATHGGKGLDGHYAMPADLPNASAESQCRATVAITVEALDLQTGIYGIQLVMDDAYGCALLEVNFRPHGWPLLMEPSFQRLFSPDVCMLMALLIAC